MKDNYKTGSTNDRSVTKKMNVKFKNEDEYKKFINGETHSNKGIRSNKGRLGSQPDIETIDEAESDSESIFEYSYDQDYLRTSQEHKEDGFAVEIMKAIIEGLVKGVGEALSDEENREILASLVGEWWKDKVVHPAKKTWTNVSEKVGTKTATIRNALSGKTKAEQILSGRKARIKRKEHVTTAALSITNSTFAEPVENIDDKSHYRESISWEEAQRQYDQIKVLALLLADKIKKLSNSYIEDSDMSPEEQLIRNNAIMELTTQEVMNSIRLLLENDSFSLDNSTSSILSEFLSGNLIAGDGIVHIENFGGREPVHVRPIVNDERMMNKERIQI